ncbi:MAG: NAD(P)-dependent oxidoreductase [Isosphaeraceae bacterium]
MRPGSYLINTARGGVVDQNALLEHLDSGHLEGAALDVVEREPLDDERIRNHPKIILTPHSAFYSVEGFIELAQRPRKRFAGSSVARHHATGSISSRPGSPGGTIDPSGEAREGWWERSHRKSFSEFARTLLLDRPSNPTQPGGGEIPWLLGAGVRAAWPGTSYETRNWSLRGPTTVPNRLRGLSQDLDTTHGGLLRRRRCPLLPTRQSLADVEGPVHAEPHEPDAVGQPQPAEPRYADARQPGERQSGHGHPALRSSLW